MSEIEIALIAWLYVVGFVGLNDLSRQFSNKARTRKTWIGLVLWPVAIPIAWMADKFDELVP